MIFRSRKSSDGETATAEKRPEFAEAERLADEGRLFDAIDTLSVANRAGRDPELEREIRRYRHLAGIELLENAPENPAHPEPDNASLPEIDPTSKVPEVTPDQLTPELVRAAFLSSGCLLIRGAMDAERAGNLAADIDRSFEIRGALGEGESDPDGYYDELQPEDPYRVAEREWVEEGGGVLAADSPRMLFDMLDAFEQANLRSVIEGYLGEKPAISAQKCTLRKAMPEVKGGWHQDGKFMGDVRSLNVWMSLSRCGDVAPSMDIVPRRLDDFVATGGEGAFLDFQISDKTVAEAAGEIGVVRPIFNPGDALLFDDLFLHQTGSDPSMPNPRYAIESWFFGPSSYPDDYVPIAF